MFFLDFSTHKTSSNIESSLTPSWRISLLPKEGGKITNRRVAYGWTFWRISIANNADKLWIKEEK